MGNIDDLVDEEVLQNAFIPFGDLVSVFIPRQDVSQTAAGKAALAANAPILGKHKGFGFVEFEDPDDAKEAIENMHESELYGRVIRCNLANPKAARAQSAWADADKWYEALGRGSGEGGEGGEEGVGNVEGEGQEEGKSTTGMDDHGS